jgi:cell division protein FtsN
MNAQTEAFEEEYEEYDEFDEEDDGERGLSGLVVLLMGIVMLGAFASVVWIAYQQGIKTGDSQRDSATVVAADPEPLKIEPAQGAAGAADRPVYDKVAGNQGEPVETVAPGPEEPVTRSAEDPIAAIASGEDKGAPVVDDAVADRIASLAAADKTLPQGQQSAPAQTKPAQIPPPPSQAPAQAATSGSALAGSHVVQVGAFKSQEEADGAWSRLQGKLGDYLNGKSRDVERADLGDKGVFYRQRIGPFASADDARTYCEGLKTRGQDCLIKAK